MIQNNYKNITIGSPNVITGSKIVSNSEILKNFPEYKDADIINRTGIYSRYHIDNNESIVELASASIISLLKENNLEISDIDMLINTSSTPNKYYSPSFACIILDKVFKDLNISDNKNIPAFDVNAACSGFIYALHYAYYFLYANPEKIVIIINSEHMSKKVNPKDFDTAFLFGDACTSTIVFGANLFKKKNYVLKKIIIKSIPENGNILNVPTSKKRFIKLIGSKLFYIAVKKMKEALEECCNDLNIKCKDLDIIVPHQANLRLINALEKYIKMEDKVFKNIKNFGNTSSCSIPIAIQQILNKYEQYKNIGICSFGSGFTYGAAVLENKYIENF